MKSLKEHILEGLLDIENNINADITEAVIEQFLKENYDIRGSYTIKETKKGFVVDIKGGVMVKNKNITSLTNGLFKFGTVGEHFYCGYCKSLTSLEGAPQKVGGEFDCAHCDNLTSLEGAPKEVGWDFYCTQCRSLKSLKGAPQKVGGSFNCKGCDVQFTEEDVRKYSKVTGDVYA